MSDVRSAPDGCRGWHPRAERALAWPGNQEWQIVSRQRQITRGFPSPRLNVGACSWRLQSIGLRWRVTSVGRGRQRDGGAGKTCLRWLNRNTPDVERARRATTRILDSGIRAAEIIGRLLAFYKKSAPPPRELVDVNQIVGESTVEPVVRRAHCSVLTVRADAIAASVAA